MKYKLIRLKETTHERLNKIPLKKGWINDCTRSISYDNLINFLIDIYEATK